MRPDETKRDEMTQEQTRQDEIPLLSERLRCGEFKCSAISTLLLDGGQRSIQVLMCLISGDISGSNQVSSSLSALSAGRETDSRKKKNVVVCSFRFFHHLLFFVTFFNRPGLTPKFQKPLTAV